MGTARARGGGRASRERRAQFPLAPAPRARAGCSPFSLWRSRRFCRSSPATISSASRRKCSSSCSMRRASIFCSAGGGLVSFGHAAYFGLGSYGAAIALKAFGLGMETAIPAGILLGLAGALVFGWFCVRLSGVYFAMLTLAFAQIAWSIAFQWTDVTGGDNGIIGVWPSAWAASPARFYWLTLALSAGGVALLRVITFSPFGYALRALRDSTLARRDDRHRAAARAMDRLRDRRRFRGAGRRALRLSQGQRVSRQPLDFAVDRRARDGAARRRRHGVGRRRRRGDLPVAVDLGDQPHRLFQARARRPHHPAGRAVPEGPRRRVRSLAKRAGACWPPWRNA